MRRLKKTLATDCLGILVQEPVEIQLLPDSATLGTLWTRQLSIQKTRKNQKVLPVDNPEMQLAEAGLGKTD